MISQSGKNIVQQFVSKTKDLLLKNTISILQEHYGIWQDGHTIPVEKLSTDDTDVIQVARMLRERLKHIANSIPDATENKDKAAVEQLVAEQSFTILNRFCAIRMCEERGLIFESIRKGYNSEGFQSYDMVTGGGSSGNQFTRYKWYIHSVFDELSVELPAVFDRFSHYCLVFPDETTLLALLELINAENLTAYYDEQTGETINFWQEDETIGWIYQYYNSLEERRKMREESNKPRNSREMAVRNQFFTPDYVVRFLTDNTLGRIWFEMTGGRSKIYEFCEFLVHKPDEEIEPRAIKEPTEIRTMDPTCGSMHFGLYAFGVYEYIYMDAWDNYPELLQEYRYTMTRKDFQKAVPALILEKNIYGCEIDPRALQMAAMSLWLRAQRAYNELEIPKEERPLIKHSNLILAEPMPGNKKMLKYLMSELDPPMQRLITKIWDKMQFVGEAGLLIKMEHEIEKEIADLKKNWYKVNVSKDISLFSQTIDEDIKENERILKMAKAEAKEAFFSQVKEKLQEALSKISQQLSADEGYENALFTEDATRGFAFIELCQQRFDVIVMNPPFGEGSENSSSYLDLNYKNWCKNLVCAFFIRMNEMLTPEGRLGAIFDRTVLIKSSYEEFRKDNLCGYIDFCADTGWGVLDAMVETSTMIIHKTPDDRDGIFVNILNIDPEHKSNTLLSSLHNYQNDAPKDNTYICPSSSFISLPNTIIGYYFDREILEFFKNRTLEERNYNARQGHAFISAMHYRLFFELVDYKDQHGLYNGGPFSMFLEVYRDCVKWKNNGAAAKAHPSFRNSSGEYQLLGGVGYGKRGEIVDAHILHKDQFFTVEGLAIPGLNELDSKIVLSYLNSIIGQYSINLYTAQHKHAGYMNLLPMPEYMEYSKSLIGIVDEILKIKRYWFSFDETNPEYRGLIKVVANKASITESITSIQDEVSLDAQRYESLVEKNDEIWIHASNTTEGSVLSDLLNSYKGNRPKEELFSIDNISEDNLLRNEIIVQEILQELVGLAFGRWDIDYITGKKQIPAFGDIFDPLPFMPVVSLNKIPADYPISVPADGILMGNEESPISIVKQIRNVMVAIWGDKANDIEYELCQLIGHETLQEYFDSPQGFFDYHLKRYTKSRRKAPIYWPLSSQNGKYTVWVYYPKMTANTLPQIVLMLGKEIEQVRSELTASQLNHDRVLENELRIRLDDLENMTDTIKGINDLPYKPNHDDGVPVTAAPLADLFKNNVWHTECVGNLESLHKGDYDWSHLAYTMFPARIREKAKKDWCMALTHGLEEICEKKPKEKKSRTKSASDSATEDELF